MQGYQRVFVNGQEIPVFDPTQPYEDSAFTDEERPIKKALCKALIRAYIKENKIKTANAVMQKLPDIFEYLKGYKENGKEINPIPKNLSYNIFLAYAQEGLIRAQMLDHMTNQGFARF